ncbi:HelicaseC-terminal [Penicillium desertorum]|uniref:HelicaseC-terminal n=1 Tax=Penicillium desertorum TaxID=1303715 RepID=A0A9W9WFF9_9EURO|nr:HelicaseC-terminal [Penicillium desertorum]
MFRGEETPEDIGAVLLAPLPPLTLLSCRRWSPNCDGRDQGPVELIDRELRDMLGQIAEYMDLMDLKYGALTTTLDDFCVPTTGTDECPPAEDRPSANAGHQNTGPETDPPPAHGDDRGFGIFFARTAQDRSADLLTSRVAVARYLAHDYTKPVRDGKSGALETPPVQYWSADKA